MGNSFSKKPEARILVLGLDNAGKSTMVAHLRIGEFEKTIPTIGFNVETVKTKKMVLNLWDVGGQDRIRPLWKHYYTDAQALVFVVDSSDKERMQQAKTELKNVINDPEMANAILLVCCNKQDIEDALTPDEVSQLLDLNSIKGHKVCAHPVSAKTGDGLDDAVKWLTKNIPKKQ